MYFSEVNLGSDFDLSDNQERSDLCRKDIKAKFEIFLYFISGSLSNLFALLQRDTRLAAASALRGARRIFSEMRS